MHVLVTGGAGYVGSRVVAHLLHRGYRVTVFDKLVHGAEALLPFDLDSRFELVQGDVRNAGRSRKPLAALTLSSTLRGWLASQPVPPIRRSRGRSIWRDRKR